MYTVFYGSVRMKFILTILFVSIKIPFFLLNLSEKGRK